MAPGGAVQRPFRGDVSTFSRCDSTVIP